MPQDSAPLRSIRVAVVDDDPMVRASIRNVVAYLDDIEFVGEAADGGRGVELAVDLMPDVMLIDFKMPEMDGIAATREITRRAPEVNVIGMTSLDADGLVPDMLRAGAAGFLRKSDVEELEPAIRGVAAGERFASHGATISLMAEAAAGASRDERRQAESRFAGLTPRVIEVVEALAFGLTSAQVAERLGISPHTVDTHKKAAIRETNAGNFTRLLILADRAGYGPANL